MSAAVHVVVVTYNSAAVLPGLLNSLEAGMAGVDDWTLHVADNASHDDSVDLVELAWPRAEICRLLHNRGYAAGINAALAGVDSQAYVLILNPDVRLLPGSVAQMLQRVEPGSGILAPRMLDERRQLVYSLYRRPTLLRAVGEGLLGGPRAGMHSSLGENVRSTAQYARSHVVEWATGAAFLITPECRAAVGRWDESFFLYSEETDYCLRAADSGFTVKYLADVSVIHLGGESTTSPYLRSILTYNRVRLYRKRHSGAATGLFYLAVVLGAAVRVARGSERDGAALRILLWPPARPSVLRNRNVSRVP